MKKLVLFGFILLSFSVLGCNSTKKIETSVEVPVVTETESPVLTNHSFLAEENIGQKVVIAGELKKGSVNYYIVETPESKSKVTFTIVVPETLIDSAEVLVDKKVKATGILTAASSPWKKEMELTEITSW